MVLQRIDEDMLIIGPLFISDPTPIPTPSREVPVFYEGAGDTQTPTFTISGGTYEIIWYAETKAPECHFAGRLVSTVTKQAQTFADVQVAKGSPRLEQSKYLHDVAAGEYYFEITGRCRWHVSIIGRY